MFTFFLSAIIGVFVLDMWVGANEIRRSFLKKPAQVITPYPSCTILPGNPGVLASESNKQRVRLAFKAIHISNQSVITNTENRIYAAASHASSRS